MDFDTVGVVIWVSSIIGLVLLLMAGGAWLYGYLNADKILAKANATPVWNFRALRDIKDVAILIACYNGEATIGSTVRSALKTHCDVYVVSDASPDATAEVARQAGATVLQLEKNSGKPAALLEGYKHFNLSERYKAVAILDDDVTIEPNFIRRCIKLMTSEVAIVVGKNITWWPDEQRWNIWLAKRAYSYWSYQLLIRRIQSFLGVMNCISGSNSVYRTELLDNVLHTMPPYIVDDTFWVLETHRRKLGKIVYAPKAHAYLQDPTNFRDWYKQNLRWLWGTFQGIIGHRVGKSWTRFDIAYVVLMCQWVIYVLSAPLAIWLLIIIGIQHPLAAALYLAGYGAWIACAAVQLRRPRLILFIPVIAVTDLLYRVIFVHALIKALRQPTVEKCVWDSPTRISTETI